MIKKNVRELKAFLGTIESGKAIYQHSEPESSINQETKPLKKLNLRLILNLSAKILLRKRILFCLHLDKLILPG